VKSFSAQIFGEMADFSRSRFVPAIASICGLIICSLPVIGAHADTLMNPDGWPDRDQRRAGRTVVLGFDGMDPKLAQQWMDAGELPNFRRLAEQGNFQPLPTTNPAQSPVAWSSFATGENPGAHGLFDFLRRDVNTYAPVYAIARDEGSSKKLEFLGFSIPLSDARIVNSRVGLPFWSAAEVSGLHSSVLRVPVTFPPDNITRMLSGMGVPDLLGTQGTFTIYSTKDLSGENARTVRVTPAAGRVETKFEGPLHPLYKNPEPLSVPMSIEAVGSDQVRVDLDGTELTLSVGEWSDWVGLRFSVAYVIGVRGIVRLHLVQAFPELVLYVSPIQMDPRDPVQAISSPPDYAEELAERIGLYHTIGMPEETWSLNEGFIGDHAYLDMVKTILAEREAMWFDTLDRNDSELVVTVFVQTDRISHMFYRGLDEAHPLHESASAEARGAIEWIYGEADRILGKTMDKLAPTDRLIVLSDHGFNPFRRSVHLNRWLMEKGYMAAKAGQPDSESLFSNVNWTRTRAYAIGLNGIYLNLKGRERLGIVRAEQVAELKREIAEKLLDFVDPDTGMPVIVKVYDADDVYHGAEITHAPDLIIGYATGYRASWQTALGGVPLPLVEDNLRKWSGDHCVDPGLVPGVLFTSFKLDSPVGSISELPELVRQSFIAEKEGFDAASR
jgi:predicted AlkP superfamily phosphohydrolase/phosphomutase